MITVGIIAIGAIAIVALLAMCVIVAAGFGLLVRGYNSADAEMLLGLLCSTALLVIISFSALKWMVT